MKIGVFDSGLGGLYLLSSMVMSKDLSKYDYVYLGDTKNLPYGEKNQRQILELTSKGVDFLFRQGCQLVIVACNTSSAQALRKIQQNFLPKYYQDRRVLGVIRPTVELIKAGDTCVIATNATVKAKAYTRELRKLNSALKISEIPAPELVPLLETNQLAKLEKAVRKYSAIIENKKVKNLILGCTHYAIIGDKFAQSLGKGIKLISQDKVVPIKLLDYLNRHPKIDKKLTKKRQRKIYVTKLSLDFAKNARTWFGQKVKLELAKI
ncbi:MAG: glutamate racemase [Candidatus Doudnabacteria bacterium RIFCSPLOWO2_01_FULL_44_21]|uniref:Glutamate racemase n=1 Tax=Candidatus Doudnabacteria bacterium RIFCSPLOWO2_01_FULL_44_21 TaxID=1817841 RepID=A0A1F5Q5C0_9BACT|nr:MAG: glutamate racemase [Candidatus Doudnabacteria bacterium RIFCSPHIGHO2_02_FULL_43_13b]OGE97353.1 MAG: glutamate racemase [Candidatus Doudnabacteria bacterium RIFCSPLOWO2_01_FULL_44_21]